MTVSQAIARIDRLKPNSYGYPDKLIWLSQLDGAVKKEIIDTHEGVDWADFIPYDEATDTNRELLVPPPYDELYVHYLAAQIDYANCEYDRFNNSNSMYESVYSAFRSAYNREHTPLGSKRKYW